jgi:hypothetical protein
MKFSPPTGTAATNSTFNMTDDIFLAQILGHKLPYCFDHRLIGLLTPVIDRLYPFGSMSFARSTPNHHSQIFPLPCIGCQMALLFKDSMK